MHLPYWLNLRNASIALRIIIGLAVVAGAAVLYVAFYHPKVMQGVQLTSRRDEYRRTNDLLMAEIADLKQKQLMFNSDPAFVVITARNDNKVLTNEIVFIFPRPRKH